MRRSPRLAFALLLAAGPLSAQEKIKDAGAPETRPMPKLESSVLPKTPFRKPALLSRELAIMSGFDLKQTEKQIECEVVFVRLSDEAMKHMRFQSASSPQTPEIVRGVSANGIQRVGFNFETNPTSPDEKRRVQFVNERTKKKMFEAFQQDPKTTVVMAPKVTMQAGEPAVIEVLDRQHFVTDVKVQAVAGELVVTPNNQMVDLGTKIDLNAEISADGQSIRIKSKVKLTELSSDLVPMTPFTMKIKPKFNNGVVGAPVDFTQYLQEPSVITRSLEDTFVVPGDHSVMAYIGSASREVETMSTPTAFSRIPYLNRLFKNVSRGIQNDHLIVVITPKIYRPEVINPVGANLIEPPAKAGNKEQLKLLLKAYHEACAEGMMDDARRLAIECLVIDPT